MAVFAKALFIKQEKDGDTSYYVADADPASLVTTGEKILVGIYELVALEEIEGTITRRPTKSRAQTGEKK